jgi:parallel beta-helix repeat protein
VETIAVKKLILAFACLFVVVPSQARTITVDDDGLADFNNIQAAINDANDGDTVLVRPGTYYENISMKDGVTVQGSGANVTTIDGGASGNVVVFSSVSGILSGFNITNGQISGYNAGVYANASTVVIENNIISNNQTGIRVISNSTGIIIGNKVVDNSGTAGIWLDNSNPTVTNNLIVSNDWTGIHSKYTSASIINNTISNNGWFGINAVEPPSLQVIANNIITQNRYGFMVSGGATSAVSRLAISYNNVWDNYINYW